MISFSKLGNHGRLGNQLFQYAFLRTQAEKLGVNFYCPKWIGDEIFELKDENIRASAPEGLSKIYNEPFVQDYDRSGLNIEDNSDILGYFESEKNFDNINTRKWYSFRDEKTASIKEKYKNIDFSTSIGIHLRLGDKVSNSVLAVECFVPRVNFYLKSIEKLGDYKNLLVFSDNINIAKKYFKKTGLRFIFMEGNESWEDLYLMSCCRDFICGSSTMSWWGAWLNNNPNKKVVFSKEGLYRTGTSARNKDFIPNEWIKIRALRPIIDNYILIGSPKYYCSKFSIFFNQQIYRVGVYLRHNYPSIYKFLKTYFPDKK